MRSKVIVMDEKEFNAWYVSREQEGARAMGMKLLQDKGCLGCHSADGPAKIGPTFKGLWGRSVTVLVNGRERELVADEAYIRKAVLQPQAEVVKGYPPIMPEFPLKSEELDAIITVLKDLK